MDTFSFENLSSFSIELSRHWLWAFLVLVFIIFSIMSLVLMYHWHKYGLKSKGIFLAEAIYFLGSLFFIMGAVSSVLIF